VSVPFGIYGGICAENATALSALLQAAQDLAREKGVDHVEFRHQYPNSLSLPGKDLYVSFILELPSDPEVVWREMRKRNRNILRKGEKSGLALSRQPQLGVLEAQEVNTFYTLFARTQQALGTPVLPRSFFTHLQEEFGEHNALYSVMHEGRIITSLWVFFWQDYVSPYYIGYDPAYLQYAPNNWVLWQVIKDSCAAGYRYYDMGRSRQGTGSYEFKRHWGIEPKPLYYQYYLHRAKNIPQVNPSNPKFDIPRRLWSHLPLGLTKIIGPHLVKYLG
jgi:FemAB-related protein (PEP-CTERM system-associated)